MPCIRAKSEIGSSRSQRGRTVSLGGSARVGGSWSDARLCDEQFDAAQDRAGELEQLELVRVNDGSPWLYSASSEPSLSAREEKNLHDYVRVYRNDIDGKVQKVFSQLRHTLYSCRGL